MNERKLSHAMEYLMQQPYIGGEDVTAGAKAGASNNGPTKVVAAVAPGSALCQNGCGFRAKRSLIPCENDPPGLCDKCGGQTCDCDSCVPRDERFPMLCSDGTVIHNYLEARKKEDESPGSFTADELCPPNK